MEENQESNMSPPPKKMVLYFSGGAVTVPHAKVGQVTEVLNIVRSV